MNAVEEIGAVLRLACHWFESLERREDAARPFPAVADEIVNAPSARARGMRVHGLRIEAFETEIAVQRCRRLVAPWMRALLAVRRTVCGAMIFRLSHQAMPFPSGVLARLFVRYVHRPRQRQGQLFKGAAQKQFAVPFHPERR